MHALKICKRYLNAVNERDLPAILALFSPNAVVSSPICGTLGVREFHEHLFARQARTETRLRNIFATVNSISGVALHFSHTWMREDGKVLEIDGIDIFALTPDGTQVEKLTIVFDPTALRAATGESQEALVRES